MKQYISVTEVPNLTSLKEQSLLDNTIIFTHDCGHVFESSAVLQNKSLPILATHVSNLGQDYISDFTAHLGLNSEKWWSIF
jgi:hypothetical protein